MSEFRFQQFSVIQTNSAMKVCTDAVIFGAMAPVKLGDSTLDIGTGTGLLSLMVCQLGAGQVTAVELTLPAYDEAALNFKNSPWATQLEAVYADIQRFATNSNIHYDFIICNPPFFAEHSKAANQLRNTARHTDQLSFDDLLNSVNRLLSPQGLFYVLLPIHAIELFVVMALAAGLYLNRQIDMRGYAHNEAKVSALTFSRQTSGSDKQLLTIYKADRVYSEESESYLAQFLLRFAAKESNSRRSNGFFYKLT